MCRYSPMHNGYKNRYVCTDCRVSFKRPEHRRTPTWVEFPDKNDWPCPNCNKLMVNVGRDYRVPKRGNKNQWKKLKVLVAKGWLFHSCGCGGPGYRPRTYAEAKHGF
jgi:hypothetical protein